MTSPQEPQPHRHRYSIRRQARMDAETHATLEALSRTFPRTRAAILRSMMEWGLTHTRGWTIGPSLPDHPHLVHMLVEPERRRRVQEATDAHGTTVAAWLCYAMRQVTVEDFAPSSQLAMDEQRQGRVKRGEGD